MPESLLLSVVVPTHNSTPTLRTVLAGIRASDLPRNRYELIVVDDASADASATVAGRYADKVVRLTGRSLGRAYARNRGIELARGEIIAFVNSDVLVRPNTLRLLSETITDQPDVHAACALHDDSPAARNFVSQYWNLLLHFGEQRYVGPGADLASGCSAVRRSALAAVGAYDEWRFGAGNLEGLDLAQRLGAGAQRVVVNPNLPVTHLGEWGLGSMCREVWNRSRVLSRSLGYQRTRSAVPSEVVFTLSRAMPWALAVVFMVTLSGAFHTTAWWLPKVTMALFVFVLANSGVYRFYAAARGSIFAISAIPLHLIAQGVSAVALCTGWLLRSVIGDRAPDAATQAYAEVGLDTWPPVPRRR